MWTLLFTPALAAPSEPSEPSEPPAEPAPHEDPHEDDASHEHASHEHASHEHAPHEHAAGGDDATMHHRFDDVQRWVAVFDDPERDAWQKPAALVEALKLRPGDTVADIGAGTGYFEPHLSAAVGPAGQVLAIDVESSLISHIEARAAREGTPNVAARLGALDDPGLGRKEADLVLLVDTYHHIDDRLSYFSRLRKGVARHGRLAIVDFRADTETPVGPPPEHRLPAEQVREELAAAGWSLLESPELLPYQYVLVFER